MNTVNNMPNLSQLLAQVEQLTEQQRLIVEANVQSILNVLQTLKKVSDH